MKKYFVLLVGLLFGLMSYGQDSLLLMSGRVISVEIKSVNEEGIQFSFQNKKGKQREGLFSNDEVYSFTKKGEKETIVYVQDLENGDIYTPAEHRFYIYGEQDARNGYNSNWTKAVGFVSGVGATVWVGTGVKPFIFPVLYSFGMQIPVIKIKAKTISNPDYKSHDSYKRGYEKTARSKKFMAAFLSSMSGVIVGIAINELVD